MSLTSSQIAQIGAGIGVIVTAAGGGEQAGQIAQGVGVIAGAVLGDELGTGLPNVGPGPPPATSAGAPASTGGASVDQKPVPWVPILVGGAAVILVLALVFR